MQHKERSLAIIIEDLDILPANLAKPMPQGFGGRFLGGEAHCQGFGPTLTGFQLSRGEDALQETPAMTLCSRRHAANLEDIDASGQLHITVPQWKFQAAQGRCTFAPQLKRRAV